MIGLLLSTLLAALAKRKLVLLAGGADPVPRSDAMGSPALFTNLFQALFMAPLFVLMEVLFMFGYKSEFRIKVQAKVDENIKVFKSKKII